MENPKAAINAPCGHYSVNRKNEPKLEYPSVFCGLDCDYCGWNPKEQERRLKEGRWVEFNQRVNIETEEIMEVPNGAKKLVF